MLTNGHVQLGTGEDEDDPVDPQTHSNGRGPYDLSPIKKETSTCEKADALHAENWDIWRVTALPECQKMDHGNRGRDPYWPKTGTRTGNTNQ